MKQLSSFNLPELENLYDEYIQKAQEAGKTWAEKKAFFESLEDKRKPELARLMGQSEGSQGAKEQYAYSQPYWEEFMSAVSSARKDYLVAQVAYDMARLRIEALRTVISTRRQEISSFRG